MPFGALLLVEMIGRITSYTPKFSFNFSPSSETIVTRFWP